MKKILIYKFEFENNKYINQLFTSVYLKLNFLILNKGKLHGKLHVPEKLHGFLQQKIF